MFKRFTFAIAVCVVLGANAWSSSAAMNAAPIADLLSALLDDAARRSGANAQALRVTRVEAVTWSDSALGCPQPGLAYMQVLVPGHRVRIAAPNGTTLDYHTSTRGGRWVHCPAGRAQPPLPRAADPRI